MPIANIMGKVELVPLPEKLRKLIEDDAQLQRVNATFENFIIRGVHPERACYSCSQIFYGFLKAAEVR